MMEDPLIEKNNGLNDMSADDGGSSHDENEDKGSVGSDAFTTQLVQYKPHDDLSGLRQRRRTEAEQSSYHDLLKKSVDGDLDGDVSNRGVIVDMITQFLTARVGSAACTPLSCELQSDSADPSLGFGINDSPARCLKIKNLSSWFKDDYLDKVSTVIAEARTDCYLNLGTAKHTEQRSRDTRISIPKGNSNIEEVHAWSRKMDFELILVIITIVLECMSAIFMELSSEQNPHYALIGMILSYFAFVMCIIEIIYEGHQQIPIQRGSLYNNRPQRGKSFATFTNIVALVCVLCECAVTTIRYHRISHHKEATSIPLTVLSIISATGVSFSEILKYREREKSILISFMKSQ